MAAVSSVPTMTTSNATTFTPPTSSHDNGYSWESPPQQSEAPTFPQKALPTTELLHHGGVLTHTSPNISSEQLVYGKNATGGESFTPVSKTADYGLHYHGQENMRHDRSRNASNYPTESTLDLHDLDRGNGPVDSSKRAAGEAHVGELDDISSKWIHRDKLAQIENEELQAAGIILPRPRGRSKPRRDVSREKTPNHRGPFSEGDAAAEPRPRKESTSFSEAKPMDTSISSWDLRLPDEIAEDSYFASAHSSRGSSRIPVAKLSPAPIALEHIERDTPMARRRDGSPAVEETIAYPKTRTRSASMRQEEDGTGLAPSLPARNMTRSASDLSPKKAVSGNTPGLRKASAPTKTTSTAARPRTRNGASKDSNSSGAGLTRPSTRSGDRELSRETSAGAASKQPEGDPPWMISAYRPDPRLPPDQQLLPTVARRLQQEKWEREGKFGNVYDREFRPLTDEGFLSPPELSGKVVDPTGTADQGLVKPDEWPLKPEAKTTSSQQGRTGSYSTIPKIQDKPNMSPLPSPRSPLPHPTDAGAVHQASEHQEDGGGVKQGCGCCIVM